MAIWSEEVEDELSALIKDWLKQKGRTQADLRRSLQALSTRMPSLIEVLKDEYSKGGLPKLAARLCEVEKDWSTKPVTPPDSVMPPDPFGQLDLLLQEIREDCDELED